MSTPEEVAYHQTRMSKLRDYYCQINTMTGWLRRVDASRETLEANLVLLAAVDLIGSPQKIFKNKSRQYATT